MLPLEGIAAKNQHEVSVIDIRNRQQHAVTVHLQADQMVRQLIHRGGREAAAGLQQAEKVIAVGQQPIVMHAGIALIDGHGVLSVARLNSTEAFGDQGERLVPLDRQPLAANPAHGLAQAVGVVLNILQGHRLGANMAATETVLSVALDRANLLTAVGLQLGFDGQAADGFTEMACTVMEGLGHGLASYSC